jgi:hypothetical protein
LKCSLVCGSYIWILDSTIVTRRLKYPAEIGPKWFVKQALNHASDQQWDIREPIWLRAFSCLRSRE